MSDVSASSTCKKRKFYCGHCKKNVCKTVYYAHKKLYFKKESCTWNCEKTYIDSGDGFEFDSSSGSNSNDEDDFGIVYNMNTDASSPLSEDTAPSLSRNESDDFCLFESEDSAKDDSSDCSDTEIWFDVDATSLTDENVSSVPKEQEMLQLYVMFIFMWQSLFRISDNAIEVLLLFFATFTTVLSKTVNAGRVICTFVEKLPKTVYMAKKIIGIRRDPFIKYVSCPKCKSLYSLSECQITLQDKTIVSKKCCHVEFPCHPHFHRRQPCETDLLKPVRTSAGTTFFYPRNLYCYKKLTETLKEFLGRPEFLQKCEMWRDRPVIEGVYSDVYDGGVWKEFQSYNGVPFLSLPFNFAFILNVDWFQPFNHTTYSIGVIYIAFLNLPRQERYLPENIVLIGIIPGPHEPKLHLNTFLTPLVSELKELWCGVLMHTSTQSTMVVRGALLSVACDIPAARKVSGFVGPMSLLGCSKCLLEFPTAAFGEKPDYSNFDRSKWNARKMEEHQQISHQYLSCTTLKARKDLERKYGLRYSVLSHLPYFDAPPMTIVDPMHNLLLGTAKYTLNIWKELGFLSARNFDEMQQLVDSFVAPSDIGRIPLKIASGFSDFTADQWRNWIVYYSLPCLKSYLPFQHYNLWLFFVKACHLFCRRTIMKTEVEAADQLILQFCQMFVTLYGKTYCTPNLHLHGHLASCIEDFGPVYAFWLFSFERLNGILGSYHTNNNDVSLQLMRRFINSHTYGSQNWPEEFKNDFLPVLSKCSYYKGSLMQETFESCLKDINQVKVSPLPPIHEAVLSADVKEAVQEAISTYFPGVTFEVLMLIKKCKAIRLGQFTLGSRTSKFTTSSHVMVNRRNHSRPQLAMVHYYAQCTIRQYNPDCNISTL